MKKISAGVFVRDDLVVDYGSIGKCDLCEKAHGSTTDLFGERYCTICAYKQYPENKTAVFVKTDAKFKCPAGCGANNLSYEELQIGSCCTKAANKTYSTFRYESVAIVNGIYEEAREEEEAAEKNAATSNEEVELAKKALAKAEEKAKNAEDELGKKKAWRKKVQKRSVVLTKHAMKEDNSDLVNSEDDNNESKEKPKCKVCFENYSEDRPEAAIFPCGHKACFICLSSLPQKTCPTCRAAFTADKILKLYE
ncbi:Oidioi.mRNA.OKI2018_I69.chr1.g3742.t1.cds [Oikopleura dioica]|uniref:Oidioi.mRNA.OKI2018_I69.chr1.g3742.t1.cds n=1 Tax=Oikopleura dioica TaxID=34765 RepID=A0ABN7SZ19_OIKDI|nr:Oidioi.mRNA.OKI2018_I69.chr1.g3742.t1.cds [Oikopleura dioica]